MKLSDGQEKERDKQLKELEKADRREEEKNKPRSWPKEVLRAFAILSQIGFSMFACVFVGVLAGKLLDSWLGTGPWLLVVFSVIGAVAAFKILFEMTKE